MVKVINSLTPLRKLGSLLAFIISLINSFQDNLDFIKTNTKMNYKKLSESKIKVKLFSEKLMLFFMLILVFGAAFSEKGAAVTDKRLYGHNGTDWVPILTNSDGTLKTDTNISRMTWDSIIDAPTNLQKRWNLTSTNLYLEDNSYNVGIGTNSPTHKLNVYGTGNFSGNLTIDSDLIVTGNSYLKDFVFTANASFPDSITTDYIYENSLDSTQINNLTVLKDIRVLGNSYLGTLVFDANGTFPDSVLTDYIFPESTGTTLIDNITILKDIRVLGNSYLGSFTIEDDLVIGSNNISSTNVGIGITSPDYSLHLGDFSKNETIRLDAVSSGDAHLEFRDYDDNYGFDIRYHGTSNEEGLYFDRHENSAIGIPAMFIQRDTGNVGIGTTSPTHTLNVQGDLNVTGDAFLGSFTLQDDLVIGSNNISSTYVGIGTTGPGYKLDINSAVGSVPEVIHIGTGASATHGIYLTPYGSGHLFNTLTVGASEELRIQTGGVTSPTNMMTFDTSGNIGIGTTAPTAKLEAIATSGNILNISNGSNTHLVVTNQGLVGIGETTPQSPLSIYQNVTEAMTASWHYGTLELIDQSPADSGYEAGITFKRFRDGSGNSIQVAGISGYGSSTSDAGLRFYTNNGTNVDGLSEKMVINQAGNVGIGTTSPTAKLELEGASFTASSIRFNNSGDTSGNGWDIGVRVPTADDDYFAIERDATGFVAIDENGNVGIGTTSPGDFFSGGLPLVVGSGSGSQGMTIYHGASTIGAIYFANGTTGTDEYNGQIEYRTDLGGDLLFGTNGVSGRMVITDSGNVGIGTTSPTAELDVVGTIRASGYTEPSTGAGIDIGYTGNIGYILSVNRTLAQYEPMSLIGETFRFRTSTAGNVEGLSIDTSGNVGIGTTSPLGKLDSAWGGYGVDSVPALILGADVGNLATRTDATRKFGVIAVPHYTNSEEAVSMITFDSDSTENILLIGGSPSGYNGPTQIKFSTNLNTTDTTDNVRAIIDSSGNVGIGTTSPGSKLDLRDGNLALSDADVAQPMTVVTATNNFGLFSPISATQGGLRIRGLSDTDAVGLSIIGSIGSNNPTDTKEAIGFTAVKSDGGTDIAALGATETAFGFDVDADGLNEIVMLGSGNVGIGTTDPRFKLHVESSDQTFPALRLKTINDNVGQADDVYMEFSLNNSVGGSHGRIGFVEGAIDDWGQIYFSTIAGTGTPTERMRIQAGGNVGIGTTSPTALLHVESGDVNFSNATRSGFFFDESQNNVGIGLETSVPLAPLHIESRFSTGTTNDFLRIDRFDQAVGFTVGFNDNAADMYMGTRTDHDINIRTNNADRVTIDNSGNVGIGTTNPHSLNGVDTILEISSPSHAGIVLNDTAGGAYEIYTDSNYFNILQGTTNRLEINSSGGYDLNTAGIPGFSAGCTMKIDANGGIYC